MPTLPALFISHGAPTLAIEPSEARDFLAGLGRQLGKPEAILAVSAHWETLEPTLSLAEHPETIHDFGGFPRALYEMRYPAPGAPALAEAAAGLLREAGLSPGLSPDRGLDHGAWVPLSLIYPEADVPVTQLSVQPRRDAAAHVAVGEALKPLRERNVLVLASGGASHNLYELGRHASPPGWMTEFDRWLAEAITGNRRDDLAHWLTRAPHARQNHPTPEHLLPLFVALGAGGAGEVIHESITYGALSMAAYAFG